MATSTTGAPRGRSFHTAVWAGSRMIVWGGTDSISISLRNPLNTGGLWRALSLSLYVKN
jgi:hypothetical protein